MPHPADGDEAAARRAASHAAPSARVRLEVDVLDGDETTTADGQSTSGDDRTCRTVLVVAVEADLRRYVRECLRDRGDLRVLAAETVSGAAGIAAAWPPAVLVVDEPLRAVLDALPWAPAIIIVDELPRGERGTGAHARLLARPFTAERLMAEVDAMLRAHPPPPPPPP